MSRFDEIKKRFKANSPPCHYGALGEVQEEDVELINNAYGDIEWLIWRVEILHTAAQRAIDAYDLLKERPNEH